MGASNQLTSDQALATTDSTDPALATIDQEIGRPQRIGPKLILRVVWSMLRRRWWLLGLAFVFSVVVGVLASVPLTQKVWKATTVLLYTPPKVPDEVGTITKSLELANMAGFVTSRSVLDAANETLGGEFPVPLLEKAITAETSRTTMTVFLAIEWGDQKESSDILEQIVIEYPKCVAKVRQSIAKSLQVEVEQQIADTSTRLNSARNQLRDFLRANNIVDFKQDLILKQTRVLSLETSLSQIRRDEESMRDQIKMLEDHINSIKEEEAAEAEANKEFEAATESLADNRRRQGRLRELIEEERRVLEVKSQIDIVRREYERAKKLAEKQLIPNSQLEAVRGKLESLIAKVTESKTVKSWQDELLELDKLVVPKNSNAKKGSPIISQILFKKLETELKIAHGQKGEMELDRELMETRKQIATFQAKRGELKALEDSVDSITNEKMALDSKAAMLEQLVAMGPVEFTQVNPVSTGDFPISSNRKKMFAGIVLVTMLLSGTTIAAFDVLLRGIIPPDAQVELMGLPIICRPSDDFYEEDEEPLLEYSETIRLLALQLRQRIPNPGSIIMLSRFTESDEFPLFVQDLAHCLANRDERLLIIDTRHAADGLGEFADLIDSDEIANQLVDLQAEPEMSRASDAIDDVADDQADSDELDSGVLDEEGLDESETPLHKADIDSVVDGDFNDDIEDKMLLGLSDWLTLVVDDLKDITFRTTISATDCILPGRTPKGESLATIRMSELINHVRLRYSMVLLIAPDSELKSELQILSAYADGIAFAFDSKEPIHAAIPQSVEGLADIGAPLIGAIQL